MQRSPDGLLSCCLCPCVRGPQVREGLYYNPYFPGGAIAMPRMLADGGVEYDDGTPSNSSQQAKVGSGTHLAGHFMFLL